MQLRIPQVQNPKGGTTDHIGGGDSDPANSSVAWGQYNRCCVFHPLCSVCGRSYSAGSIKPCEQNSLSELIYFLIVIAAVMGLSALAILASLFSCTSYIPRILLRPLAVHHMMDDPDMVEDVDKMIYPDSLGQFCRHFNRNCEHFGIKQ